MLTSLGYHTFTIFRRLTIDQSNALSKAFRKFRAKTGEIRIRPMKDWQGNVIPNFYIIEYIGGRKGITWTVTYNSLLGERPYSIKATINPKIFTDNNDYIAAANSDYLKRVETLFNAEIEKISPVLGQFRWYSLHRIDYCLNLSLRELGFRCSPEQMIKLIKQSNIPPHFTERTRYDTRANRTKSDKHSFYLRCSSVIVNCYWKHWQLLNEFPDCPDLENSLNVIRFEIQCKYPKVYSMSKIITDNPDVLNVKNEMLSDEVSNTIIRQYFDRVIGKGTYYTLDTARKMVEHWKFAPKKEARLISVLEQINNRQGIYKAKAALCDAEIDEFNRSLRELAMIDVNPVTVPRDWGIKCIPNLISSYDRKTEIEQVREQMADDYEELRKKKSKSK
jgi:hypothetical protein